MIVMGLIQSQPGMPSQDSVLALKSPRAVVTLLTVPDLSDLSERLLVFLRVLWASQAALPKELGCAERLHSVMCLGFQRALPSLTDVHAMTLMSPRPQGASLFKPLLHCHLPISVWVKKLATPGSLGLGTASHCEEHN